VVQDWVSHFAVNRLDNGLLLRPQPGAVECTMRQMIEFSPMVPEVSVTANRIAQTNQSGSVDHWIMASFGTMAFDWFL